MVERDREPLLDIAPRELEKVLYFAASIVTGVDNEARAKDLADLEDKVRAESEQIYVDRDEQLAALEGDGQPGIGDALVRCGATRRPAVRQGWTALPDGGTLAPHRR